MHNGETSGHQIIRDASTICTTSFIRTNVSYGGGSWTARATLEENPDHTSSKPSRRHLYKDTATTVVYFYLMQTTGWEFDVINDGRQLRGRTPELGNFTINFYVPDTVIRLRQTALKEDQPENILRRILEMASPEGSIPWNMNEREPTTYMLEIIGQLPLTVEIEFVSDRAPKHTLHQDRYTQELSRQQDDFEVRFESTFHLHERGFSPEEVQFAQRALSNTLGSVGYWSGQSVVRSPNGTTPVAYFTNDLMSGVPSRNYAPHGFIWDEGFHQLLIQRWTPKVTRTVLGYWLDSMNTDGYIPREQALDSETRAKVPHGMLVQDTDTANPPTWFLVVERLLDDLEVMHDRKEASQMLTWLKAAYPRLLAWFDWFVNMHQAENGAYRWKGRLRLAEDSNPLTHSSGMPDFPRVTHPGSAERHLDLWCWLAMSIKMLRRLARVTDNPLPHEELFHTLTSEQELARLHWSERHGGFFDYGFHTFQPKAFARRSFASDAFGYPSLMPMIFKLLRPDSHRLERILTDLANTSLLWSPFGVRSLSMTSRYYHKHNSMEEPPYWRGAVWINMNYLVLRGLDHYKRIPGPCRSKAKQLYDSLHPIVINTVLAEYKRTGKLWEHYLDDTGQGAGSHPFTGWTSLVVLIMSELY
eukprot:TRINITY_DN10643_c0_g1_i3.p1 TRINITY_DN10643_c0_g1~~TRINITY_DN10643_c0_g1_i3.p1  ORF type:complete len:680 (+),score=135.02 TRINITY_DN10643_c0_g1_i3:113-2041(+)